jgi:DNA helicase IV
MGDIVATIQAEQDLIIRAPFPGLLIVQGGPGTGKTAVALHRAAYLLYTNRQRLEDAGVLVVGPNRVVLRYIEHVLPSLGESGVELATIDGLYGRARLNGNDSAMAERVKGDARMVAVLRKAVQDRERTPTTPVGRRSPSGCAAPCGASIADRSSSGWPNCPASCPSTPTTSSTPSTSSRPPR